MAFSVLVLVGIGLLVNPIVPGIHVGDGSVYRYEAARVTYNGTDGLAVVDVAGGEAPAGIDIDDDVVCERGVTTARVCAFEAAVLDGTDVPTHRGEVSRADYSYVYLDDTFYEPTVEERDDGPYAALEPVTESDPLERIAMEGDLSAPARAAISGEQVLVHEELTEANRLIRNEGTYYTIYRSAHKRYGSRGSFCASNGEGFCDAADTKRWVDTLLTLGSRVLGGVLLVAAFRLRWEERGE